MLTREGVKAIYKRDFWDAANVGSLPPSIIFQLFDFAINSGIQTAIRYMQKTVGAADDGHWGPMSQGKADAMAESDMLMLLIANRQDFMTNLKGWQDFGKGWIRRMSSNLRYAAQDNEV
jgi:lysozyme family protein